MDNVYLLIGGNLGNRVENLENAIGLINTRAGQIIRTSVIYETAAWGITDQKSFLNQALELDTSHPPTILLDIILEIERELGRIRREKNGPRLIDIDILFYGSSIIADPRLTVPHPLLQERRFALAPMNNISPDFIHPAFNKTVKQLLAECKDPLRVEPYQATTGE
ncbi:2-amino-4-hydroxy-6-hydroxymethyldihydropteridine diphosphokinase [Flavitalea sp.]|nr:2-amino-4-hydroxy-6-hydroxymethyldihydropteridine diphosphokinase [Flavitalea sp.]